MSIEQVGILQLVIILVVWLICAAVAWTLAPDRDMTFFLVTLLILGPLGVAAALIAQPRDPEPAPAPRRPVAAGRRRFICPRCGAENDIPESVSITTHFRVSTGQQSIEQQQDAVASAGIIPDRVVTDTATGCAGSDRTGWEM
jgi:hypothetical protein